MSTTAKRVVLAATALVAIGVAAGFAILFLGKGRAGPPADGSPAGTTGAQATKALYRCPMHPTMVADRPGDCPICQMRMVPVEKEQSAAGAWPTAPGRAPARKRLLYRSTMNPGETSDAPGKDSMGMEMVPVEVEDGGPGEAKVEGLTAVRIPIRKQQLIGVRTTVVRRSPFVRTIRTVGRVVADETRLHHVHTKVEGWIEKLYVNTTGERVRKGQPLLTLYSPELLATQEEYLLALKARGDLAPEVLPEAAKRADELLESARRRLLLYDFTPDQIRHLAETAEASRTVTLYAPMSGHALVRKVSHGEKIDSGTTILEIADLSRVWVLASVYEYELPFVKVGQAGRVTLSYLPGKSYTGGVTFVYPILEGATRTVQVRLEFPNPGLELKPGMYADVELRSDLGERLAVPQSAVLSSGTRDVVFVAQGEGYFEPREVRLGLRADDAVEVLDGLSEGETVVSSAAFLIDSESKLKAALEAAAAPKPGAVPEPGGASKPAQEK